MAVKRWQLQEAKQQFSRVVDRAHAGEPQLVTRNGKEVAVVLDVDEYRRLSSNGRDFKRFLLEGPYVDEIPYERSDELPREVSV